MKDLGGVERKRVEDEGPDLGDEFREIDGQSLLLGIHPL